MPYKFNPFTGTLDAAGGDATTSLLNLLGTVANQAALPSSGTTIGDVWQAEDTGEFFVWDGTEWDGLGDFVGLKGDPGDPGDPAPGTDLTYDAANREVRSSTGDDAELPLVSTSTAGLMAAEDKVKLNAAVVSDPSGITGADAVTNIVSLTQAEYDAIATPSATTLYVITR